jgi:aldehyde:ferredoxin oxidoreductase
MRAYSRQNKPTASYESAMIQEALLNQSKQIAYQQEQLNNLGKGFRDIAEILQEQHQSNPKKAIEETNQSVVVLGNAIVSLHQQLKQANLGQGLADIKSQQQVIGKSVTTTRKALDNQTENLASYLGWKRIVMLVASTAVISSLCNLAIASLAPIVIGQFTGNSQFNKSETAQPVEKKQKKGRVK